MASHVKFEVLGGPLRGREFVCVGHDTLVVGRGHDCHILLPEEDTTVSRHHCLIEANAPTVVIRDLGSLNGTWVNGVGYYGCKESTPSACPPQVAEVLLRNGDRIEVGGASLRVQMEEKSAPAPIPAVGKNNPAELWRQLIPIQPTKESLPVIPGFTFERLLGKGGFSSVFLARRSGQDLPVAVKILRAQAAIVEADRRRFDREIELMKQLSHKNVVPLLGHGSVGMSFYFEMEYCERGSLADLAKERGGKIPLDEAGPLFLQMLAGLAHAHSRGLVHRDIKPHNVLLKNTPHTAKVADFGLARKFQQMSFSGVTLTGMYGGSPYFMPSEQIINFKRLQPQSDVWSAAALFYHMLTGLYPRDFLGQSDPLAVVLGGEIVPIRQRDRSLPKKLTDIIDRALRENPIERHSDARALRTALANVL